MLDSEQFRRRVADCALRLEASGPSALGSLFDLTAQRLSRLAVALTRHAQDAEDAVQAALVRLATEPQRLARADCPWAYLLQMVRNEALQICRRRQRCASSSDLSGVVTWCAVDESEREETHRAVWAALRGLPPEQIEVVVLKIWEEFTFAEIAKVLEISPNTAASRFQYAISKLTRRLLPRQEVRDA